jgi:hypothetical protein
LAAIRERIPACLVAALDSAASPRFVVILPITRARPERDTVGVEIPAKVREALGLDAIDRSPYSAVRFS